MGRRGYLGDSFVGEWVNFGAGTTNSNLKNNYSPVSIKVNGKNVDSIYAIPECTITKCMHGQNIQ